MNRNLSPRTCFILALGAVSLFGACQQSPATSEQKPKHTEKPLNAYWTELSRIPANLPRRTEALPDNYRVLKLDLPALRQQLNQATDATTPVTVAMPLPTGREMLFSVTPAAVMDPKLAAKYPQLKTYKGTSANNPTASVRFELNQHGLKAMVYEASARYLIEPYLPTDSVHYLSYERGMPNAKFNNAPVHIQGKPQLPAQATD